MPGFVTIRRINNMKKQPEEITLCTLEVVVMPNGEIICLGESLGYFKKFKKVLKPVKSKGKAIKL